MQHERVLVLDFGGQYNQLIARRVRDLKVYCDLKSCDMTAEQIFMELRRTYPTVVLATVYNNLNRLWQDDLIRKVSVEGTPDRYDRIQRHDHLVCKECGKLLDVDLGDLTAQLEQKAGAAILSYDLKLVYLCDECRKKKGM